MFVHIETQESWARRPTLHGAPITVCGENPTLIDGPVVWAVYNYDEAVQAIDGKAMKVGKIPPCRACMRIIVASLSDA